MTGLRPLAIPLQPAQPAQAEDPPPPHPTCRAFAQSDYCRESWQLHLAELDQRPRCHWHRCDFGRLCAVVPLVSKNCCLAAFKLVCLDSIGRDTFLGKAQLLGMLVDQVARAESTVLARLARGQQWALYTGAPSRLPSDRSCEKHARHPQVARALEYIKKNLSDPGLTVSRTARALDVHPDYLSHLFAVQLGERMHTYIAARRVDRAKHLLATTEWQVKRIAAESGFANSNWFDHVFKTLTGKTPGEFRREASARRRLRIS